MGAFTGVERTAFPRGVGRTVPLISAGVPVPNRTYKRVRNVRSRGGEATFVGRRKGAKAARTSVELPRWN